MSYSNPISFLSRLVWQYSAGRRGTVLLYVGCFVVAAGIWTLQPYFFGELINTIQANNGVHAENISRVLFFVAALFSVELVSWVFHGPARIIEREHAHRVLQSYRAHLVHGVFALPLSWHSERDSGHTLDKIQKASDALFAFTGSSFNVIFFLVRMTLTTAVLAYYSVWVALITLALILASFVVTYLFDVRIVAHDAEVLKKGNVLSARLTDALTNIFSVKILHIEEPVFTGIMHASRADLPWFKKLIRANEWKWCIGGLIFAVISLVPIFAYMFLAQSAGTFALGTFTALYLYSSNLIYVYYGFNGNYEELMRWKTRIQGVQDIEEAIHEHEAHPRHAVGEWEALHLKNIFFSYGSASLTAGDEQQHIDNVSLTIYRGQRIALIGTSGSGKTTFLKVLHGMYSNAAGMYAVERDIGYKIKDIRHEPAVHNVWAHTTFADIDLNSTLVPQEPEVFSSTIRENLTLGQDFSEADITSALAAARFTDVLPLLPKGIESVVNEKGVNLSGGQKQRLALARALLFGQHKTLLLLDESTSNVDPENEAAIYEAVFARYSGQTVLATIHKLNLLTYFDRIVMFENGTVVDDGTFDELLARNDAFRELWQQYLAQRSDTGRVG